MTGDGPAVTVAPDAPRERQRIRVPAERFPGLREWAVERTGLAAAARVRDPDGRVAFVENAWSERWILPGGEVEPGETPREAAVREVREETGLDATVVAPLVVAEQEYVSDSGDGPVRAAYVVYDATASGRIPDPEGLGETADEIRAARWFEATPDGLHDDWLRPYL